MGQLLSPYMTVSLAHRFKQNFRWLALYLPPGLPSYAKSLYLKKVGGNFRDGRKQLFNAGCHGGTPDGNDYLITTLLNLIRLLNSGL